MLIIPEPKTRQRRIKVGTASPPALLPLAVIAVGDVQFHGGTGRVTVTIDVNAGYALEDPESADPAKWTVVRNGTLYVGTAFGLDGDNGLIVMVESASPATGPNVVNYAADPSDIQDTQGRMLAAVSGFPF